MSHFVVLVLTEQKLKNRQDAQHVASEMMEPYNENLKVEEHKQDCYCIGNKARDMARKAAEKKLGTNIKKLRDEVLFHAIKKWEPFAEETDEAWKKHVKQFVDLEEELFQKHKLRDKPNPKCEQCQGHGWYTTDSTPSGHWDWFEIGGRWTGTYSGYDPEKDPRNQEMCDICHGTGKRNDELGKKARKEDPTYTCNGCGGVGKRTKFCLEPHEGDVLPVEAVLAVYEKCGPPFAFITSDGEWVERGRMMMFGMSDDKKSKDEWKKDAKAILESHKSCTAIVCDCHC